MDDIPLTSFLEGPDNFLTFGSHLANVGDVHGDGLDDLVIGYGHFGRYTPPGIYLNETYNELNHLLSGRGDRDLNYSRLELLENMSKSWYLSSQRALGDVNGDDHVDVVSTPLHFPRPPVHYSVLPNDWYSLPFVPASLHVRYGSDEGLKSTPDTVIDVAAQGKPVHLKMVVFGGVGDVNGDGFDDLCAVIVGHNQPDEDDPDHQVYVGAELQLFYGSKSGLPPQPSWRESYNETEAEMWEHLVGIHHADVNGDGFADAIFVSSDGISVTVHNGSSSGLERFPSATLDFLPHDGFMHLRVHAPLDLNGDAHEDLIIEGSGMYWWVDIDDLDDIDLATDLKGLYLFTYMGSPKGLTPEPTQNLTVPHGHVPKLVDMQGSPPPFLPTTMVATSDINGDGLHDLLVHTYEQIGIAVICVGWQDPADVFDLTLDIRFNLKGTFRHEADYEYRMETVAGLGLRVSAGGDFDGDGYGDVAIGVMGDIIACSMDFNYSDYRIRPGRVLFVWGGGFMDHLDPVWLDGGPRLYAGHRAYDFRVNASYPGMVEAPWSVGLTLDPGGADVRLMWRLDRQGNPFYVEHDPDHYVRLESTEEDTIGDSYNSRFFLHFRVWFNWTWPHEAPCWAVVDIDRRDNWSLAPLIVRDVFSVENDLDLHGPIGATGEWQGALREGDWVRAGETVTVTGPVLVYEGTTDVFPPTGVCNVTLVDDDGDSTDAPTVSGSPALLTVSMDDGTDLDETLTLTVRDLPGSAELRSEPRFRLRVDGDAPAFRNPVPDGEDWHSLSSVLVSITADDTGTSGVDGATLEYTHSTGGNASFGEWTRAGLATDADGALIDGLVTIELPDGDDNFVRWRVRDVVGNEVVSGPFRIKVDTQNVTYTGAVPDPGEWQTRVPVSCGVTVTDLEGSGIDVSTIQFRASPRNLSRYGDWTGFAGAGHEDMVEVTVREAIELAESGHNYVQWRAMDIAGNGYTTSPHYRVRVDTTPIAFSDFSPSPDEYQNTTTVSCRVTVSDGPLGSGVDLSTVEYGLERMEGDIIFIEWFPLGMEGIKGSSRLDLEIPLSNGDNHIHFRGSDVAGNGLSMSEGYIVVVDTEPPVFFRVAPGPDEKQPSATVHVTVLVLDPIGGLDPGRVWCRYGTAGEASLGEWSGFDIITLTSEGQSFGLDLDLAPGIDNVVQFRAFDLAGNEALSGLHTIWVNRAPVAVISSPAEGSELYAGSEVALSADGSFDEDGDELVYTWYLEDSTEFLAEEAGALVSLPEGAHNVTLVVTDDTGAEGRKTVQVTILDAPPQRVVEGGDDITLVLILLVILVALVAAVILYLRGRGIPDMDEAVE